MSMSTASEEYFRRACETAHMATNAFVPSRSTKVLVAENEAGNRGSSWVSPNDAVVDGWSLTHLYSCVETISAVGSSREPCA